MQSSVPFSNFNVSLNGATEVNGRAFRESDTSFYSLVSTNFVSASGIHLIRGRDFQKWDDSAAAMVGLVNEAFVKQYLPTRDPIGATVKLHRTPGETDAGLPFAQVLTIIGVVENELQGSDLDAPYQPMVYIDYRQIPTGSDFAQVFNLVGEFAIRSNLGQFALDTQLRAITKQTAPDMSELSLQLMQAGIAQSLSQRRLALSLVASFGAIALLLASIGIYGVLTYSVIQRRKEIAIRMALGSSRAGAIKLIVQQASRMVVVGFMLGAAAAWPAGRAVKSFLFGVQALDSTALLSSAAVLLAVCAVATAIPALRAAQNDPIEALRAE
jgi:ABC-type antimicrobial peptide transport system permease subunit